MTLEVVIRQPMVTQPPIKRNLDCLAKPFHSELCFDKETFRHQPELRDSFHLLQRYHLEQLMTPRDFFYPRVVEVLRIPYEPVRPKVYRVWAHPSQSDMVHILSKGTSTRSYLLRKELPPSMFLLDALLHHNLFPLQHMVQKR